MPVFFFTAGLVCEKGQLRAGKDGGGPRIPGDAGGLLELFLFLFLSHFDFLRLCLKVCAWERRLPT